MMPCNGVSAAESCASRSSCDATWSAVLGDQTLCSTPGESYSVYTCGGYDVLDEFGNDTGALYFYDGSSGALVAITGGGNFGPFCLAGPPTGFVQPDCQLDGPPGPPPQCLADAGPEGGSPD